jgi:uncharacterized tellurite resistance protein B-like protein
VEGIKVLLGSFRARMNAADLAAAKVKAQKEEEERQSAAKAAQEKAEVEAKAKQEIEARQHAEMKANLDKQAAVQRDAEAAKKKQLKASEPKSSAITGQPKQPIQPPTPIVSLSSPSPDPPVFPVLLAVSMLGLFTLVVRARYRKSDAGKAYQTAQNALSTLEGLDRSIKNLQRQTRETEYLASKNHAAAMQMAKLRTIPIEELKSLAPGVRLQALRDHGFRNLADLVQWPESSLTRIRGIGPESAHKIHSAAAALGSRAERQPNPFPWPISEAGPERPLLEAIYHQKHATDWFADPQGQLPALIREFSERAADVKRRTTFWKWINARGGLPELLSAVTNARSMEAAIAGDSKAGQICREFKKCLTDADASRRCGISWADLKREFEAEPENYKERICSLLGINPVGVNIPAPIALSPRTPTVLVNHINQRTAVSIAPPEPEDSSILPWVPPDTEALICEFKVQGGLFYIRPPGTSNHRNIPEPSCIDPQLPIARTSADCRIRRMGYWPSYNSISPEARASYLQWLASGKSDPEADIGYVFLYFYGLERRILVDFPRDIAARNELPTIEAELERLLAIYRSNASFNSYASSLLDYLRAGRGLDDQTLALAHPSKGMPLLTLRAVLGRFAKEGKPLTSEWALAWFTSNGTCRKRPVLERCPEMFQAAFNAEFERRFPMGLPLPLNKTRLRLSHRAASAALNGNLHTVELDLPDVSVLSAPAARLQEMGDAAAASLEAYNRFIGRNPDQANSLDGMVLLPPDLWPAPFRDSIATLKSECDTKSEPNLIRLVDLQLMLPEGQEFTKARYAALCRAFQSVGIGIEPDVQFGGSIPDIQDPIALFGLSEGAVAQPSPGFNGAAMLLHLASAVAGSDGSFSSQEVDLLLNQIKQGLELPTDETRRLEARLHLFRKVPPQLAGLKRRIESLDPRVKAAIGVFLVNVVQADGIVEQAEVRSLEKIYKLLGLSTAELYSKLHEAASEPIIVRPGNEGGVTYRIPAPPVSANPEPSLKLDMTKVAALKEDSARVSALLGAIFTEQQPESQPEQEEEEEEDLITAQVEAGTLPGLDTAHNSLLQTLLQRPQWTRAELEEMCTDRGLMPDGAIEQINEASFERFEEAMIEGDDPLDIRCDLILEEAV